MRFKYLFLIVVFLSVSSLYSRQPKAGTYRALLFLHPDQNIQLPFSFELAYKNKKPFIVIRNAEEKIQVDEIRIRKDSIYIRMPFFNSEFRCKFTENTLEGDWINYYRKENRSIPFKAMHGDMRRFEEEPGPFDPVLEGRWEVQFRASDGALTRAIGLFHHIEQSNYISGTFLTETGDYRYLEGVFTGKKLLLSCFDGSHAFLFSAELDDKKNLQGQFYSGNHWQESWTARLNEKASLRDPSKITWSKDPGAKVSFAFPDTGARIISSDDSVFAGKVMLIQLMGSWCPNCMDESKYLTELYKKYHHKGLEIVALAFEKSEDFKTAKGYVQRMVNRLGIPYPVLVTQKSGKDMAMKTFPYLNEITAFPTTLFLNKDHQIVNIHTGFNGPATGHEYEKFVLETETLLAELLK
ncbi:MAG TPA: TlpA disulfide reductase family protein [Bacteroidia bacterium]|nr:TlpA disulfide reductase family protein [Bacteroidia bacterium]